MKRIYILFFILFSIQISQAQSTDTLLQIDESVQHSPTRATLYSLAVPGLGQAYNKKYWKIPLVYAAIGIPLFIGLDQHSKYEDFKKAYQLRVDGDSTTIDRYVDVYENPNDLLNLIDFHRKNRDLSFVLTGIAYALNVVDATVDAHLFEFNVSDDLTASLKPKVNYSFSQQLVIPSLTLSLKFTKKPHRNTISPEYVFN